MLAPQQTMRLGLGVAIDPERAAGHCIERDDVIRPLRDAHHAIDHERCRLPVARDRRLIHPLQLQILDVGRRDLVEKAETMTLVVAGVRQPVLRLRISGGEALGCHLSMHARRQEADQRGRATHQEEATASHHDGPFSESR